MTKEQRSDQIKLLRRQEDRRKRLPGLIADLSKIADREFSENDVLTLEQIDNHQIQINSSDFRFNFLNQNFAIGQETNLSKLLSVLEVPLSRKNYLALSHSSDIAVFDIKTSFITLTFEKIIKLDKDTFTLYDHDYKNGMWIDLFEDYWHLDNTTHLIWIYEFRVFGTDWIKLISKHL